MLSYSAIVQKAYKTTMQYPSLWLFGLFAVGGFNLNFLNYENIPLREFKLRLQLLGLAQFFQQHPAWLALISLSLLFVTLFGLIITNWSRVMLILAGESVLQKSFIGLNELPVKSSRQLWTVIKISMLTASLILVVALALFGPPLILDIDPNLRIILLECGAIIFLPMAFAISCMNIFATFYAVVYKKTMSAALNLATDFFVSRWTQILGLVCLLMVLYFASFVVGVGLIFVARLVFDLLFLTLARFNILSFSAIIVMLKIISNVLLWVLLAGLSVFFNQALLILFFELNTPIETEEEVTTAKAVPATTST